jgi:hypothetical protein
VINLSSRMSHNNNTVIDVTSLLRLWSCHTNHNISATRTQPYPTDGQTDRLTNTFALHGLEEPFFQLCCTYVVSVFGSGGKKVLVYICMYYLEYNTVMVVC